MWGLLQRAAHFVAVGPVVTEASHSKLKAFHARLRGPLLWVLVHMSACIFICFPVLSQQGFPLAAIYVFLFVYSVS